MLKLYYQKGSKSKIYPLKDERTLIGRKGDCDVVLDDFTVSRRHASILKQEEEYFIEDLESRNGVKLNGEKIQERKKLTEGDEIVLGNILITVNDEKSQNGMIVSENDTDGIEEEEGTVVRPMNEGIEQFLEDRDKESKDAPLKREKLEEKNRLLKVLSEVGKTLISVEPLQDTLDKVMDLVFKHIPAKRGFLMLKDENENLTPYIIKHREREETEGLKISETIADKVINEKVSILSTDVQSDPRFKEGESIKILGIESAMCVPLWDKNKVIGIIHVDTPTEGQTFGENDLDLLSALANYAAVAIERARLSEEIEREKEMKRKLERYHSPDVAEKIMETEDKSGAYNLKAVGQEATVLFADIADFTSITDPLSPVEISNFLNEFFSRLTDSIFKYQGTLDKYIGDGLMAVFGAPIEQEDHAKNAVLSAFDMLNKVDNLNRERSEDKNLKLHIGINSGEVVAGDIGSVKRADYTVLGKTVNIASRLEEETEPDEIFVGKSTYENIKHLVKADSLGKRKLRGIADKISIYKLTELED